MQRNGVRLLVASCFWQFTEVILLGEFNVDEIRDVDWDDAPCNNLVLPEGEKELVLAFADRPRLSTQGFDDFIAHKGTFRVLGRAYNPYLKC